MSEKRVPSEWEKLYNIKILDPDGWRVDNQGWDIPITEKEWQERMRISTVSNIAVAINNDIKYRVWVITNVPNKARYYFVVSPEEGKRMIDAIADEHLLVPDNIISSNAFGLHVLQNGVWEEWEDENGNSIDEIFNQE